MGQVGVGLSVALAVAVVTFASAGPAAAQGGSADTDARAAFEEGRAAYDAGEFEAAVRGFRRAYLLSPRFALLYNIAQAELRAGNDALALEAFEGFLRQAPPDDERRGEVEERVRVLRGMGVRAASSPEVRAEEPAPAMPEARVEAARARAEAIAAARSDGGGADPAPWIVLGAGGALAVAGAVLLGVGAGEAGRVTGAPDGARWSELEGVASGAEAMWAAGFVLLGVGAAAMVAGLAWGIAGSGGGERASARLRVLPGGARIEGTF
ncbi:MAG: tetratricopeptide repeat protein [Sandaracinaceae bacterium]|nr:tetratricopeptide repeat protein [Sandaracinaceae bacterium]